MYSSSEAVAKTIGTAHAGCSARTTVKAFRHAAYAAQLHSAAACPRQSVKHHCFSSERKAQGLVSEWSVELPNRQWLLSKSTPLAASIQALAKHRLLQWMPCPEGARAKQIGYLGVLRRAMRDSQGERDQFRHENQLDRHSSSTKSRERREEPQRLEGSDSFGRMAKCETD